MRLLMSFRMAVALLWWDLSPYVVTPRPIKRRGKHGAGTPALTTIARLASERDEPMPERQPAQHRRSRLWD